MADDAPEITVLQLPKFKAEAAELIGTDLSADERKQLRQVAAHLKGAQ